LRYIYKDTDEWIASADAGPRQRLFDAIDQNCSCAHLNHLVSASNIDVSSFRDLIVSHAIQACSYDALAWIQDSLKVDLDKIRYASGNSLLHQISALPKAVRFFERAAYIADEDIEEEEEGGHVTMFSVNYEREFGGLILQLDQQGRFFFHLVAAGNIRALDLALTPGGRFAWDPASALFCSSPKDSPGIEPLPSFYTRTRDEKGANVRNAAKNLGHHNMVKMVDEYSTWLTVYELACSLQHSPELNRIKANILPKFGGISNAAILRKLRHLYSFKKAGSHLLHLPAICGRNVSNVNLSLLSWLVENEPAFPQVSSIDERTTANVNEFARPEFFDTAMQWGQSESMGLAALAARGEPPRLSATVVARESYVYDVLADFLLNVRCEEGLAAYIKKVMAERSRHLHDIKGLLEYKLYLLGDHDFLSQRLKTLKYLKEKGHPLPSVLDIIRWRQCGVLRWMVSESYIDLARPVVDFPSPDRFVEKVHFLGGGLLSEFASAGVFLCFAAAEFDDLQSLEWLIIEQNMPVTMPQCNGWNLLHACAYFGRTEIVHWIVHRAIHLDGFTAANQFILNTVIGRNIETCTLRTLQCIKATLSSLIFCSRTGTHIRTEMASRYIGMRNGLNMGL
jgi:Ankyrin repeats (many copies)